MSLEFLLTSLVVVLLPGTGVIYTLASSLAGGFRAGFFAAFGCTLGIIPHIAMSIAGLAAPSRRCSIWGCFTYSIWPGASSEAAAR
jgi:threonine/homoserine/homoserine lactone efflux protein